MSFPHCSNPRYINFSAQKQKTGFRYTEYWKPLAERVIYNLLFPDMNGAYTQSSKVNPCVDENKPGVRVAKSGGGI